jgi:hypothetical protein
MNAFPPYFDIKLDAAQKTSALPRRMDAPLAIAGQARSLPRTHRTGHVLSRDAHRFPMGRVPHAFMRARPFAAVQQTFAQATERRTYSRHSCGYAIEATWILPR